MKAYKLVILIATLLWSIVTDVSAQDKKPERMIAHTDSVSIGFRQSKWNLDPAFGNNKAVLDSIDSRLTRVFNDSVYRLRHINVYGGASPEGSVAFNKFLSEERAAAIFKYFDKYGQLADLDKTFTFYGRDWDGVLRLAEADPNLPYRDETLALLRTIADEKRASGSEPERSLERIKQLRGGVPYSYLYRNVFPTVRASKLVIDYDHVIAPEVEQRRKTETVVFKTDTVYIERVIERVIEVHDTVYIDTCHERPFYMDVRSNMIYDALALPNVGAEFYLGKNLSLGANWLYGWWKCDHRHHYWRAYGGEIFGRWWFGKAAHEKPLTGHHLGIYGQLYTYDFEWGGDGEMGGKPGGNLWDRNLWGVGVEYGYSLPVGRRINIDFSLGLGYSGGLYHKYTPIDDHYVWQSTHRRKYFGPTKLEIAFVWLIGHGNVNEKKG